jgi:all-trans-retinol 13,14-reductase
LDHSAHEVEGSLDIKRDYDAIIIGSGISGLMAAGFLAKSGLTVLVLERHHTAGGMTHTFKRKGYEWAVGVHYVGEVHHNHSLLRRLSDAVSDGELIWQKIPGPYDRIIISDKIYDFVPGKDAFKSKMDGYFPGESAAIDRYLRLLDDVQSCAPWFFAQKALPRVWGRVLGKTKGSSQFLQYARTTTSRVMQGLSPNPLLQRVLTGQWLDYGLAPEHSSFAMHALVARHYLDGASYPVGGPSKIASSIGKFLAHYGGQIVTNTPVQAILFDKNRAVGVVLASGEHILTKRVISAAGIQATYDRLIPEKIRIESGLSTEFTQITPSTAHIGLYLGLKASAEELRLSHGNLWIHRHHDLIPPAWSRIEKTIGAEIPVIFVSFPSIKDPTWDVNHPGRSTIEMVVPVPWIAFRPWQNTDWHKRGESYEALKQNLGEGLIDILSHYVFGLKKYLDHMEISTPLTTAHFTNAYQGSMYGLSHSPARFMMPALHPDSGLKQLFLTGQDVVTCGLGGAALSGALTALRILGPWRGRHLIHLLSSSL